ncbi:MAG: polysaccharide deacetylase family protein [Candidatus Binatia bacterium]
MKQALYHSGLLALARLARTRVRGIVLRYHALTDADTPVAYAAPDICLPVEAFRAQMAFVKRAYTVVSLDTLVDAVIRGGKLPPRALVITFDDGYADNRHLGLPVLQALDLPATIYVTTGPIEGRAHFWVSAARAIALAARGEMLVVPGLEPIHLRPDREAAAKALTRALVPLEAAVRAERLAAVARAAAVDVDRILAGTMLTWTQVRELAAAGWTIGAHTVTHSNVALVGRTGAEAEIAGSRDAIQAATGARVSHFCYPNSGGQHTYFTTETVEVLRRLGFRSATTSRRGALRPGTDPFLLPRLGVSPRLAPVMELAAAMERQRLAA